MVTLRFVNYVQDHILSSWIMFKVTFRLRGLCSRSHSVFVDYAQVISNNLLIDFWKPYLLLLHSPAISLGFIILGDVFAYVTVC